MADLVNQVDDELSVTTADGQLRVDFRPAPGGLPSFGVSDFSLRVRFPANVESAVGTSTVSGNTVSWIGPEVLQPNAALSASSRIVQEATVPVRWAGPIGPDPDSPWRPPD